MLKTTLSLGIFLLSASALAAFPTAPQQPTDCLRTLSPHDQGLVGGALANPLSRPFGYLPARARVVVSNSLAISVLAQAELDSNPELDGGDAQTRAEACERARQDVEHLGVRGALNIVPDMALEVAVTRVRSNNNNRIGKTCCVCYTDTQPEKHVHWYRKGCSVWFAGKGCYDSQKIPQPEGDSLSVPELLTACRAGLVNIGYVGHWSDSSSTVNYIKKLLVPTSRAYNASIYYENTACSAMNRPEEVLETLNEYRLPTGRSIHIRGNQAISIGVWTRLLGGSYNFRADVSHGASEVEFPLCKKYENRSCSRMFFQEGETGRCKTRDDDLITLICCRKRVDAWIPRSDGRGGMTRASLRRWVWSRYEQCDEQVNARRGAEEYLESIAGRLEEMRDNPALSPREDE